MTNNFGFLQTDQGVYNEKVRELIRKGQNRLIVNINDLRRKLPKRTAWSVCMSRRLSVYLFVCMCLTACSMKQSMKSSHSKLAIIQWRDASLNTFDYCIREMHLSIHLTIVLERCISQYI